MPRGPRMTYENAIVNIAARRNNKRILFKKEKDYRYFGSLLLKYKRLYNLCIYHYCLMRSHVHLLFKITEPLALSRAMQGLQLSYFHYFVRKYGYVGRFWQGRFYSKLVEDERYLLTAGLYIERNPVRAGLVKDPSEYEWSSYNRYAYGSKNFLIDVDPYYLSLGNTNEERQKNYRELMKDYLKVESDVLYLSID